MKNDFTSRLESIVFPSISLLITIITFVVVMFSSLIRTGPFSTLLQSQTISSLSPAWFHYFVLHPVFLRTIVRVEIVCLMLSSVLTLFLLCKSKPSATVNKCMQRIIRAILIETVVGTVLLIFCMSLYFFNIFFRPQSLISWGGISNLVKNLIFTVGETALIAGIISLIGTAVFFTAGELFVRLWPSTPAGPGRAE
jgi:hypothetical protein